MAVGSAELIWLAVEHESLLSIKGEETQACFGCLRVKHIAGLGVDDGSDNLVKTWRLGRP